MDDAAGAAARSGGASVGEAAPGALEIRDLTVAYERGRPVLKGVSVAVDGRGMTAIIGPSGTGKSTLIRSINRLVEPSGGEIRFRGVDIVRLRGAALRRMRRHIGMVFQEYNLVERLTVMENLLCGRLGYVSTFAAWMRRFPQPSIAAAFDLLDAVGLAEYARKRADSLSGGQRQRVGIARALMQEPSLLLADEPTSSLDPRTSVEIMELMAGLARRRNIPMIVNMHDVELARRFADRILGMSAGEIVFDGPPAALDDAVLTRIYGGEKWLQTA
ncbi:MAG: phosphonate ABC transporter ATP-binding protein [Rhodospirillaceae bacterium]|nr:phosphonate ABC transporter ATP-binding protein [Rhodospirillaceae bacterium]